MKIKHLPYANHRIRAKRVKIIDEEGQVLGEFPIREAINIAKGKGLDLVEMAPNAKPPVCKIMDFGRYLYEKKRQERESRKHQHRTVVREMRLSLKISEHDYQIKLAKIKEFLMDGDRVKISLRLRGREMLHANLGMKILEKLVVDVQGLGKVEKGPHQEERFLNLAFFPEKKRR